MPYLLWHYVPESLYFPKVLPLQLSTLPNSKAKILVTPTVPIPATKMSIPQSHHRHLQAFVKMFSFCFIG